MSRPTPFTWRKSPLILEMSYSFGQAYNGYVDIGFLGLLPGEQSGGLRVHLLAIVPRMFAELVAMIACNDDERIVVQMGSFEGRDERSKPEG